MGKNKFSNKYHDRYDHTKNFKVHFSKISDKYYTVLTASLPSGFLFLHKLAELISQKLLHLEEQLFTVICYLTVI
jgi:hypothetical protein